MHRERFTFAPFVRDCVCFAGYPQFLLIRLKKFRILKKFLSLYFNVRNWLHLSSRREHPIFVNDTFTVRVIGSRNCCRLPFVSNKKAGKTYDVLPAKLSYNSSFVNKNFSHNLSAIILEFRHLSNNRIFS